MVERIREILQANNLTPTQFADSIGVARPIISHILSGRNKPSLEVVQKITEAFPAISLSWLLKGVGTMAAAATASSATPTTTAEPASAAIADAVPAPTLQDKQKPSKSPRSAPQGGRSASDTANASSVSPAGLFDALNSPEASSASALRAESARQGANTSVKQQRTAPKRFLIGVTPELTAALPGGLVDSVATTQEHLDASEASASLPATPAPLPMQAFAELGKAIRRIVIFYQDGTFTDYQPEQKV